MRHDYRAEPVRKLVVMGESNAYGMCATDPQNEWVEIVAALIRRHQDGYLRVRNNAIPANVMSPASPGYMRLEGEYAMAPSAVERYVDDMIAHRPDVCIYAYGLNDANCGHETESFLRDYEKIVRETRSLLPEALVVLVGPYWVVQHDEELWGDPEYEWHRKAYEPFARGGRDLVVAYNAGICDLANRYGCLFVDVYSVLEGATWLVHRDACHFTDVGQAVIGFCVFARLAANCSFLARKSIALFRDGEFSIQDTGGTSAAPHIIATWRYRPPGREPWRRDVTEAGGA